MPPHLHPRSAATSTLFAGTLVASFVVVAVPHIWPCPRPRKAHMDSEIVFDADGRPMRRVRKTRAQEQGKDAAAESQALSKELHSESAFQPASDRSSGRSRTLQEEAEILRQLQAEAAAIEQENARRECPVPKPKGVLGRLLGFEENTKDAEQR